MAPKIFNVPSAVQDTFNAFLSDTSLFALPLQSSSSAGELVSLPAVSLPNPPNASFQIALARLDATPLISPKTALYLLLRRDDNALYAITYVPHLASDEEKKLYIENRHELVRTLGEANFVASLICKEPAEITDMRSWEERDMHMSDCESCAPERSGRSEKETTKDFGYHKNKCRLCDRRMKHKIEQRASEALSDFGHDGDCVQLSVDMSSEKLKLNFHDKGVAPSLVAERIPTAYPSFTFYRHSESHVTYFIFCSPDSVPVKERMTHTMAIPGLVNIIAKENGLEIDQKIEIHGADELEFAERDQRIGRFRSMYLRNEFVGTESTWENMDAAQGILDSYQI
ncbi:hypothetical protein K504DRAFT_486553 [Pleomassaria siparia CBS 279.74]|uniref:ADF-H domain-containing protein n=1 Tax=Pleomassaria siparia CBS 279.74 TaxID=1314801 RepID=A0A6G1KQW3_9PLEO|nr:hypothetical protein K504DRAFT_486553 [Pleomassaria siparia CBS 279.74]